MISKLNEGKFAELRMKSCEGKNVFPFVNLNLSEQRMRKNYNKKLRKLINEIFKRNLLEIFASFTQLSSLE